ncbi:MAG: tandem-95 repeat protein, partial [Gammaproteobacteria bacterium]|nr:tandem-95 repeat protein [Gammaproteobacteria bacterium]
SDNIIRIVVPRAAVGANVGESITDFLIRARLNLVAATLTPDNMPDSLVGFGSYKLVGSENCEVVENTPPVANDDTAMTDAGSSVVIDVVGGSTPGAVADSDADGDTLSITGTSKPAKGSVTNDAQTVTYTPNAGYSGTDSFTYTISDGNGGMDTATVMVTVNEVANNNPPIARDDNAKTPRGKSIDIFVLSNDSDPDGDALTVISIDPPENGSAVNNPNNSITYTPDNGFKGKDEFTYTISDGNGGTASALVKVKVTKKDKDDDGSSDDDSSSKDDDSSSKDDASSDDGSSNDGCSKDADCDGKSNDSDSDDDNDGVPDDQDSDDDGDSIDDEYDSEGYDEVQSQNATIPALDSVSYHIEVGPEVASVFAVATGAGSEMLQIQISDSTGMPVGTAISGIGRLTAYAQTMLMGTYTITISNPTPSAIDFEYMTVRQKF